MDRKTREKEIPEKKTRAVSELIRLIKTSNSITITSIKNLPTSQFQLIKKKLREHATVKVTKKNLMIRAIEGAEKGSLKDFKKYIIEDTAIIFSELNPFEISAILSKNKSMTRAKIGQIMKEDVSVEPGPTELVPGPVISELGALGLKFAIEDGKINIKDKKVIVKAGQAVNESAASIMSKLGMKPVAVGLEPIAAYDSKENAIYENIKIDQEKMIEDMKIAASKALAFAVKLVYPCKETIGFLLAKANSQEKAIARLIKEEAK